MLTWQGKGGEPGGGTRKALRWDYAWCVGRAAKGVQLRSKQGSWGRHGVWWDLDIVVGAHPASLLC